MGIYFGVEKTHLAVAVDGESGSGKTGLAGRIAAAYGIVCVPTGKMYRAVAVLTNRRGKRMEDSIADAIEIAQKVEFTFVDGRMVADGEDLTDEIGTKEVGQTVSYFAKIEEVRAALVPVQRKMACAQPSVMEGRDITSVVMPDADVKLYVEAKLENRASWRFAELPETEKRRRSLAEVQRELAARDESDKNRSIAPLIRVQGALDIRSDDNGSAEETAKRVQMLIEDVCAAYGVRPVGVSV